jgi:hypothetical protein
MPAGADADRLRKARLCAANNVDWYQCVFRAHGLESGRAATHWQSRAAPPPYYSNLVTLSPDGQDGQLAAIQALDANLGRGFSLKDSFSALDLGGLGFEILFQAQWIWREAAAPRLAAAPGWERVSTNADLALWERGWNGSSPADMRVFPPSMLDVPEIGFFGLKKDGRYEAGCIGNRSADTVGFSNFYAPSQNKTRHLNSAVSMAAAFAPALPVAGYERGPDLERALKSGFQSAGALRIWLKQR